MMIKTPNRTNGPLESAILSYFKVPSTARAPLNASCFISRCGSAHVQSRYGYQAHALAVRGGCRHGLAKGGTELSFLFFSRVLVASVSRACRTFQARSRLIGDAREEGIGAIGMSVVQGATWCLSRMLLLIMSASIQLPHRRVWRGFVGRHGASAVAETC
jgi:hypothetical protein